MAVVEKKAVNSVLSSSEVHLVDLYIEKYRELKELEAVVASLKGTIEGIMAEKDLQEIISTDGSKIKTSLRNTAPTSAIYTSYKYEDVLPFLVSKNSKICIEKVINRDVLEALANKGDIDKTVLSLKVLRPSVTILTYPKK